MVKAKQKIIQNSLYKGGLQYHFIVEHELRDQGIDETNFDKHPENPHVQGNLLRGIVNCLGVARFVVQVCYKTLDNSFRIFFSIFQLKSIKEVTKKYIQLKNCNF